ncbi:hypothetical protein C8J57DRAFT_1247676 [Mycena rebaudengoi]|nr:hypothetical protein C8J57DRAFT_1247676 [Mycena rebaudengoi]
MERVELAVDEDGERRKGPVGDVGRVAGAVSLEAIAVGAGRSRHQNWYNQPPKAKKIYPNYASAERALIGEWQFTPDGNERALPGKSLALCYQVEELKQRRTVTPKWRHLATVDLRAPSVHFMVKDAGCTAAPS